MAHVKELSTKILLDALAYTTTTTGSAVDLQGLASPGVRGMRATVSCGIATGTSASVTIKIQESDTTTSADFSDISGATFTALTTTTASSESIYFRTNKRYVRAVATYTSNTTSASLAVWTTGELRQS